MWKGWSSWTQRNTQEQCQAEEPQQPNQRKRSALTWLVPGLSQGTHQPDGPEMTPVSESTGDALLIALQTEGGYWLQGSGTYYGVQGKNTLELYKTCWGMFRGRTKGGEREGSKWFGELPEGENRRNKGIEGVGHVVNRLLTSTLAQPHVPILSDHHHVSCFLISNYFSGRGGSMCMCVYGGGANKSHVGVRMPVLSARGENGVHA